MGKDIKKSVCLLATYSPFAINIQPLLDQIKELERLAEIGRATEKWFVDGHIMEYTNNEVYGIDDLIDWVKED